jgi:hypothetical protein
MAADARTTAKQTYLALARRPGPFLSRCCFLLMARGPRLQKVTVSLLKAGLNRSEALRDRDDLVGHRVPDIDSEQDSLFVASNPPHAPGWTAYLVVHP